MTTDDLRQAALAGGIVERLAYADFCEERGDDLGTLIRLACQVKQFNLSCSVRFRAEGCNPFRELCSVCRIDIFRTAVLAPLLATIDAAWEVCPELIEARTLGNVISHRCTICQGSGRIGKLWRSCPECDGHGELSHSNRTCTRCSGYGVLLPENTPLWELWCVLVLTFDPRADQVRRGDVAVILGLLAEVKP